MVWKGTGVTECTEPGAGRTALPKRGWSSDLKDEQEFIEGEVWVGRRIGSLLGRGRDSVCEDLWYRRASQ